MKINSLFFSFFFIFFFCFLFLSSTVNAQLGTELGAVSGSVHWGTETMSSPLKIVYTGQNTGFSTYTLINANVNFYNSGFVLPPDTYTVAIQPYRESFGDRLYPTVASKTVVVTAGQTTIVADFDLAATSGIARGTLKVNGVNTGGLIQFCDSSPTAPCPTPLVYTSERPTFSFPASGFSIPVAPGNYRVHVTTTGNLDAGIVVITVTAGQINNDPSLQFETELGAISGTVHWGTESMSSPIKIVYTGQNTGFSSSTQINVNVNSFNSGFVLLPDMYTVAIQPYRQSFGDREYPTVATQTVIVTGGQTSTTTDFDLVTTSGLVKGTLQVNGINTGGLIQFCDSNPSVSCPTPLVYSSQRPIYSFSAGGFSIPVAPGTYRAHVTTTDNLDAGIVSITVVAGQTSSLQFQRGLGAVSGTVHWGTKAMSAPLKIVFTGQTTGFSTYTQINANATSYNSGFILPADTYTVAIQPYRESFGDRIYPTVASQAVAVTGGQTATADFDLATTSGLVKGTLKVNGVFAAGLIQFCDPSPTVSCPTPLVYSSAHPIYSFSAGGFSIPIVPGDYRAHVTTTAGVDVCIVPINVSTGIVIDNLSCNNPTLPPITTVTLATQNVDGTYSNPTIVTLLATADTGYTIANTYYKVDGGEQQKYTAPFSVSGHGEHTIEYWSVDDSGVQEASKTETFTIYVNQAPVLDPLQEQTIQGGDTYSATGSFTDLDSTSWTAIVDYGEGAGQEVLSLTGNTFALNNLYEQSGTYTVTVTITDNHGAVGVEAAMVNVTEEVRQLTELKPARVWIGLQNIRSIGILFDIKAEVYKEDSLVSSGRVNSFYPGITGRFVTANVATVPFDSFAPVDFPEGSELKMKVSVRNACRGSLRRNGVARLWYNDKKADSRVGATIGGEVNDYFLRENFVLAMTAGSAKKFVDVAVGKKCGEFKPFGTWTVQL